MSASVRDMVKTQFAFLLFRPIKPDLEKGFWSYLAMITVTTWLVGIGRYWDHPSAEIWQYAGLGSLAYIFVLSAVLYLVVWPMGPSNWRFSTVLIFVGLTSLPAVLYAIPVEKFVDLYTAQSMNAWFLGIVAIWRVALYVWFLMKVACLHWALIMLATILPISGIILMLAILNLEHVVFNLMGGLRETPPGPHDTAYGIVVLLSLFAFFAFPFSMLCYICVVCSRVVPHD